MCDTWMCSESTSATRRAMLGRTCSWAGRDAPLLSRGDWGGRPGSFRRQGHTLAISDSHWLERWGVLGFRGCGLQPDTAPSNQSRCRQRNLSAQSRTDCGHNDDGPRRGCWGEERRSCVSSSPTSRAGLGDGSPGGLTRPRHNAGSTARLRGKAQPSQEAVVRRDRCGSHLRAQAAAAGLECAVCEASHHPRWHEDRPLVSGAGDRGFLGGSGYSDVVRQLCALEPFQGTAFFFGAIRPLLVSSKLEGFGIATCWSSLFRGAFGRRSGSFGSGDGKCRQYASHVTFSHAVNTHSLLHITLHGSSVGARFVSSAWSSMCAT